MTKTKAQVRQETVKIMPFLSERETVQLFLNETPYEEETETGIESGFLYDFHEFTEKVGVLDHDDILANPQDYIDYKPIDPEDNKTSIGLVEQVLQNKADIEFIKVLEGIYD